MNEEQEKSGVWVAYYHDATIVVSSIYLSEIDALRAINGDGFNRVAFVPFGAGIMEVLK